MKPIKVNEAKNTLGVSPSVARKLLELRDAIARSDGYSKDGSNAADAWHILYSIADPEFSSLTPWAKLESLAASPEVSKAVIDALAEAARKSLYALREVAKETRFSGHGLNFPLTIQEIESALALVEGRQ